MKIHDLAPAPGSTRPKRRVGRGIAGKGGKTAGRGTKGQGARSSVKPGFEGGQLPLAQRIPKLTGVWTTPSDEKIEPAKIAAIGIHISRAVTSHGFALNVNIDLNDFDLIIPCGLVARPVTSIARETGTPVSLDHLWAGWRSEYVTSVGTPPATEAGGGAGVLALEEVAHCSTGPEWV